MRPAHARPAHLLVLAAALAAPALPALAGCGPKECQFRGTMNDASNLTMRRQLLKSGMGDFCQQMLTHDAPLRLAPDSPVIGRFFPQQCTAPDSDDGNLHVSFSGIGYGFTNVSKKMTFTTSASAVYRYDFLVTEGDPCQVFAYFRPASVNQTNFAVNRIENGAVALLNTFTSMGDAFGKQLVSDKIGQGFTVIHDPANATDEFGIGIVPLGQKPFHPYQVHGADRVTYENERVEVHQNERDFIGPIAVEGDGRAIYVTAQVDGAPAVDVLLLDKATGDASLRLYFDYPAIGPLSGPPRTSDVLTQGRELKRGIPVPAGMYYVVFDNSPSAGQVSPPSNQLDDRAAVVNYLIQIGDAS